MPSRGAKEKYRTQPDTETPEKLLLRKELKEIIQRKLSALEAEERTILELRFGLGGKPEMTLAEIASAGVVNLTVAQIAHIERRAVRKLARLEPVFGPSTKKDVLKLFEQ